MTILGGFKAHVRKQGYENEEQIWLDSSPNMQTMKDVATT
jgi:hypothetical protein